MAPFERIAKAGGLLAVGLCAMIAAFAAPAHAQSKADYCHHYADRAVHQAHDSHKWHCHFSGARWHEHWQGHYGWCLSVPRSTSRRESRIRQRRLHHCHDDYYHH